MLAARSGRTASGPMAGMMRDTMRDRYKIMPIISALRAALTSWPNRKVESRIATSVWPVVVRGSAFRGAIAARGHVSLFDVCVEAS